MNATLPAIDRTLSDTTTPDSDAGTRQRVLQIVAAAGPVSAAELAAQLDLAPAGIRRHLGVLEATDQITVHDGSSVPKGRGRPARRYVVTSRGQASLSHRYSELARLVHHLLSPVLVGRYVMLLVSDAFLCKKIFCRFAVCAGRRAVYYYFYCIRNCHKVIFSNVSFAVKKC